MNVVLWIIQAVLGVQSFAGGLYKIVNFGEIANMPQIGALPRAGWSALGGFEMICGILLVAPVAVKGMRALTPVAAAALMLESLALAAVYARYSTDVVATNPLVWVVAEALLAALVAYGRSPSRPRAGLASRA